MRYVRHNPNVIELEHKSFFHEMCAEKESGESQKHPYSKRYPG